jgi:putative transposase
MMQMLGTRYVSWFNRRYRRTGTLWEGRFKSSLVDSERYLLTCYRYVEMNPVRAAMVDDPAGYAWSSYAANALDRPDALLSEHPVFTSLAPTRIERCSAYRQLVRQSTSDDDLEAIRQHGQQQRALGSPRFQAAIEALAGRCVSVRPQGRPTSSRDEAG